MTTGSICDDSEGRRSAEGAAKEAGSDGMTGWTTSSAEEGGRTGLGEGERDDGCIRVCICGSNMRRGVRAGALRVVVLVPG